MIAPTILAVAFLADLIAAKVCHNFTVPVDISSRNGVFNKIATPESALDSTTFIQNLTTQGENFTDKALSGYATVSGTYNVSARFCAPSGGSSSKGSIVQVLTHGIGFDKSYWDISYKNFSYSYINTAVDDYGYSTLSYDRLGIGESSHGDPKNEIQVFLEVAALASLTRKLRDGTLPTINRSFSKVIHVGHSFGSAQSYALTAANPELSDAVVLTGFSLNSSFISYFAAGGNWQQAALNQPFRLGDKTAAAAVQSIIRDYALVDLVSRVDFTTTTPYGYPRGYLVNGDANALQYLFFYPPYFETDLLYLAESTKQPVAIGEALTLGSVPMSSPFKGPVLVFTGSNDLPFCGGDCLNTGGALASIPEGAKMAFKDAKSFEAYIQPNTGHGLTTNYNATAGYKYIQDWLSANSL